MKFKQFFIAATAVLAGISLTACSSSDSSQSTLEKIKEKGTLVVATSPDYAPFEFQTLVDGENQVVGSDILLAQKIADTLGVKLEISSMNFDNVLTSVQSGKADIAIAGLSYSDERAKVFDFTESYYSADDVLLVQKSKLSDYTDQASLAGKNIAVQKGTTQETYAKENLTDSAIVSLTAASEGVNELKNSQVDAVMMDSAVAEGYVAQNDDLAIATVTFESHDSNAKVIALPKGSDDLKTELDAIIKEIVANNEYQTYLEEVSKYSISNDTE